MTAKGAAFVLMAAFLVCSIVVVAQPAPSTTTTTSSAQPPVFVDRGTDAGRHPLDNWVILTMFGSGMLVIGATWVTIPIIFAREKRLSDLIDLLKRGAVMRFVTVTYIVIVAVTLAIIDRLDGDKVATLLAGIAGYVLGQAHGDRPEQEESAKASATAEQPSNFVRADERRLPVQPRESSAS